MPGKAPTFRVAFHGTFAVAAETARMTILTTHVDGPTALEQAALVRSGQVSAVELVEAALAEIGRSELGAFVTLCGERALAEAAAVEPGDPRPLAGVPIGIKDLLAPTEGVLTTHGSSAFPDWIPERDAPHVARLRAAGAIVVGKTNTPELGLRPVTEPLRFGPTRHPRHQRLSPGGSSGGSAAAVGGGLVALCDGSDFGGSIRIPAALCGVVGLKPSAGLVPNGPDIDGAGLSRVAVFGPLARTVADAAAALDVMAGADRFAAAAAAGPGSVPVRVALSAPLGVPVDPEPRAAAERAAALLAGLGHDVREGTPDWDDDGFPDAWMTAATAGMREVIAMLEHLHGGFDPDALEPETRAWLIGTPPIPRAALEQAGAALEAYGRRIGASWPEGGVILTPTLTRLPSESGSLRADVGITDDAVRFSAFVRVFSVTGQPGITVPVTDTTGVQIAAAPGRDDLVLAVAAQLEEALR
jgi:amidase